MRHKIHPYEMGGFFHCVTCPCKEPLDKDKHQCAWAENILDVPEQTLLLLSSLGVKIGIDL